MLDSIHLARWLTQFEEDSITFYLFPSKNFRRINPDLRRLLSGESNAKYKLLKPYLNNFLIGYADFFFNTVFSIFNSSFRKILLKKILYTKSFSYVHALEIQGAGYLFSQMPENIIKSNRLILTNWGSDIYFFKNDAVHNERIKKVLKIANYYSAECIRDYKLVDNYNFYGSFLPCIPNSGGFKPNEFVTDAELLRKRNMIACKGYGGLFGRIDLALPAIKKALEKHSWIEVYFFSVTDEVEQSIQQLSYKFPNRVKYSTVKKPLSRDKLLSIFNCSLVYLGCSNSDAISTAFLESLAHGVYPIQTNTSCSEEWLRKGFLGSVVPLDEKIIEIELLKVLADIPMIQRAVRSNLFFAKKHLNYELIRSMAKTFYQI
jgi:hypothetical protein